MAVDKIVIGAGLYGLYAALYCTKRGQQVVVLEQEDRCFARATYINKPGTCDGMFLTQEYTYDAMFLKEYFLEQLNAFHNIKLIME